MSSSLKGISMSESCFFFASSPFHLFLASSIAVSEPRKKHVLLLIDQYSKINNPYKKLIDDWPESPFDMIYLSDGHYTKSRKKSVQGEKCFRKPLWSIIIDPELFIQALINE